MSEDQQLTTDWFSKPGDSLRSLMQRRGIDAQEIAIKLGGGIAQLRGILEGSIAIDARLADALTKEVGGTREFWLKRQANYEQALDRALTAAATHELDDWLNVPVPGGAPRGRLDQAKIRDELRRRLIFFNVANFQAWQTRYGRLCADTLFRTSTSFSSTESATLLWLRRGELEAEFLSTRTWNAGNLKDRLDTIRKLSRISQPTRFLPKLKALCAEAGVAVVVVKTPHGCHASGASRLIAADKAMMLLSFRYRSDEQFWFTVFHEIGHLLLHGASPFIDCDGMPDDNWEQEANQFAGQCVVPEHRLGEFRQLAGDRDSVIRFSVSVGVAPGLTVGQMQHRHMIPRNRLNILKRHWTWDEIEPAIV